MQSLASPTLLFRSRVCFFLKCFTGLRISPAYSGSTVCTRRCICFLKDWIYVSLIHHYVPLIFFEGKTWCKSSNEGV